ncbi:unnamed protein product [Mycena citricolor]|uniref:Mre11 DNA-binding domain-containing protein n=1 Tax=Mycena citricolor TaxID=2018698 RepID=A0AAD2Q0W4_9AGAR|nr:unnamed protein product [Mycena citricolor]
MRRFDLRAPDTRCRWRTDEPHKAPVPWAVRSTSMRGTRGRMMADQPVVSDTPTNKFLTARDASPLTSLTMSDDDLPGTVPGIRNRDEFPDDTIRIMLATDNHIGYMERDPIRGQDSIETFREILQLAVKHDVDFILLAGDLFHENKPSRDCLYKTIGLLREYTMGDKPIQVELLSHPYKGQAEGFTFPMINYEDPNLNVGIPVFSIHGNHDDPQGAGAEGALCALDMLSVTGLVNYIGKIDLPVSDGQAQTTGIEVNPVLLRKGNTYLGLYGIGNVKDQRMHYELRSNRVKMWMPKDKQKWFNIILLHQNRVKHGPQEFVPEGLFDDSIDLVIWGHEHDCRIVPEPVAGKGYYISQPGSSVATSLADGEAIEKHVALLQIQGKEFEMTPIPLRTVRPFQIESIVLTDVADEENLDLKDTMAISKYLKGRVNALIERANEQWDERNARAMEDGEQELPRMLPLIRLKVDTTGVSDMSNPIRFGQEFQGRLANPADVLVFHRAKKAASKSKVASAVPDGEEQEDDEEVGLSTGEKLARVRVQTLVKKYLEVQELQLLGEMEMTDAIGMFVEKDDTHAIQTYVSKAFKRITKSAQTAGDDEFDEDELDEMLASAKAEQDRLYAEKQQEADDALRTKSKGKARANGDQSDDSMMGDDLEMLAAGSAFEDDEPEPPKKKTTTRAKAATVKAPAKKAPAKKAPAKKAPAKRGKKAAASDSDSAEIIDIDEIEGSDDDSDEPPSKPARKTRCCQEGSGRQEARGSIATRICPSYRSKFSSCSFESPKQNGVSLGFPQHCTMAISLSKAESSYIRAGLLSEPPLRADGRALHDFRSISLETGMAPLANGSAHVSIGKNPHDGGGGTEVLAAAKLEVETVDVSRDEGVDGGRIVCTVSCSPSAYPHLSSSALDDLQHDMTALLHQALTHPSLHPSNLGILPGKRSWLLNLDCVVLADSGNVYDALFMASRAALWDCKVPRTRAVEFKAPAGANPPPAESGQMAMDSDAPVPQSGFDTRAIARAVDFELPDYWDEGEVLDGRDAWPICVTLNIVSVGKTYAHFLDGHLPEEAATPIRLLLIFSFTGGSSQLHSMRTLGSGELESAQIRDLVVNGEKHARTVWDALTSKLKDEDLRRGERARTKFERRQ